MKILSLPIGALLSCLVLTVLAAPAPASDEDKLASLVKKAGDVILQGLAKEEATLAKRGIKPSCRVDNIAIRREFGSLTPAQRKSYTDAVLCLQNKTALTPTSIIPGVRTRYDDFIGTHILQTGFIHFSGQFMGWHRYYTWVYEQALRNECGYTGYQPYWSWPKWANAPQNSPIFDGSAYSMSGRGQFIPGHSGVTVAIPGFPATVLPPGLGGGCVQDGPFANMTVNLGPIGSVSEPPGPLGGFGYNPRCLKRDVGPYPSQKYANYTRIYNLIANRPTIAEFQTDLEGNPAIGDLGPHGGGHFTIGGDPGGDVFVSPGDPAFYLHHAQVDRVWTLWQALDPVHRQNALYGTNTILNQPPSANTTLDDIINLGYSGGATLKFRDIMSTVKGPFCYIYV